VKLADLDTFSTERTYIFIHPGNSYNRVRFAVKGWLKKNMTVWPFNITIHKPNLATGGQTERQAGGNGSFTCAALSTGYCYSH
jgi:hypothetical protein